MSRKCNNPTHLLAKHVHKVEDSIVWLGEVSYLVLQAILTDSF